MKEKNPTRLEGAFAFQVHLTFLKSRLSSGVRSIAENEIR